MSEPVNRRRLLCQVYRDILGPCVEFQRAYAILMPDTAVLVAAEWGLRKSHQILVYRKSTNLEASRELMSYFQVACPNSPVESVIRLVGMETTSSRVLNLVMLSTGPKISSQPIFICPLTFSKIVGSTKFPFCNLGSVGLFPPQSRLAPSSRPSFTKLSYTFS